MSQLPWMTPPIYGGVPVDPSMGIPMPQKQSRGVMDRILGGLLGGGSMGGLLGEDEQKAARQQALMAMGAQLMAAGGPSDRPVSFGQALGSSIMAGQQSQRGSQEDALKALLMKSQIQKAQQQQKKKYQNVSPGGAIVDPETGRVIYQNPTAANEGPATVQEWEFFNKLSSDDQKRFLEMKRNQNALQLVDIAGGKSVFNKASGAIAPVTTAAQEATGAEQIAQATAGGKIAGETTATAQFDLPRVEDNANQMLQLLDRVEKHPGRMQATGGSSAIPVDRIPGTQARDFVSLLSQVGGKQFLEAYNTLKGGGQITEAEGKKAETAISTIQDRGQSEPAFLQAVQDLRDVVNSGVTRARRKTTAPAPAEAQKRRRYNPQTGKIE